MFREWNYVGSLFHFMVGLGVLMMVLFLGFMYVTLLSYAYIDQSKHSSSFYSKCLELSLVINIIDCSF